jgi:peptidoglycan/LPS O-acetylase OafA/YrhL
MIDTIAAPIRKEFSLYLDVLRVGAAYFVLLFHMKVHQLGPDSLLKLIPNHGHDAVILFFALSGYVIAAATDRKLAFGFREYLLDRASRVYSVALPALLFSVVLALFFQPLLKTVPTYSAANLLFSTTLNFLFMGQSWTLEELFYNQPYWSLCYEVMYYIGFGVFTFFRGWHRWLGLLAVVLISGPKVLLLLPCWMLGVLAYRYRDRFPLSATTAVFVAFIVPILILLALNKLSFGPALRAMTLDLWGERKAYLGLSNDFLIDYVTASLVAINIYASRFVRFPVILYFKEFISQAAGFSFTLYLLHFPIIFLLLNSFDRSSGGVYLFITGAVGIPILCYFIAQVTEQRRPQLRSALEKYTPGRTR